MKMKIPTFNVIMIRELSASSVWLCCGSNKPELHADVAASTKSNLLF